MTVQIQPSATGFRLTAPVECQPRGGRFLTCECAPEEREQTEKLVREVCRRWPELWPAIKAQVEKLLVEYRRPPHVTTTDFKVTLGNGAAWCDADWSIELDFQNQDGFWTVFFRDFEVIHAQPSF